MALPDFFIIGAPKAGTTALHAALAAHPGLFMSPIKEPKFFLTDGPPPAPAAGPATCRPTGSTSGGAPTTRRCSPAYWPGALRGESTPFYLYDHAAQRRISELIPAPS